MVKAGARRKDPGPTPGEQQLRSHFQGRRVGQRFALTVSVELASRRQAFQACTVDISRSGALFLLEDPAFIAGLPGTALDPFTERVQRHFEGGLVVRFKGGVLRRRMEIVRTTAGGLGGPGRPLLACRFLRPLSRRECRLVGLPGRGDDVDRPAVT
jgi:hypothetical protein